ncbi:MAG: aldo/keto reductase [Pseudomonadales bacterium]|jgi:aryl-alcohol dehydrogenase-like predicted oxidoreductase|nr:aldo/keto reductase [Pseudomonadales bacterium]MDP7359223.1 aldo/keto reductase [Pseudomonadales bacterium]MDP7595180.1 aldo/keto reductase [Pseudomonadales bacterium]HJN50177.1 aldo/keto reductase [Pseudomonadales bacterium]|tara:strand:- start:805 stop:1743 length:939 start_codon:yes stop_codon:yes gene_type:complete
MQYKNLGQTGLRVSVVGLGCSDIGSRSDAAKAKEIVAAALDADINFFDTADMYGRGSSEEYLGSALKGVPRQDVVIATKFGMPMGKGELMRGASRRYIYHAVEESLKRLGTDYIDLYQLHWSDASTPIEETLAALDDLVVAGKVRYIGSSNFTGWQIADADWIATTKRANRFVTAQNPYSLLHRNIEREVVPACQRFGLGILPYFPLASGMLTGKYSRGESPPDGTRLAWWSDRAAAEISDHNFDIIESLTQFARQRDHSLLDVAMSWLANLPYISSVIAGATSPGQVKANAAAAGWQLTQEEMREIATIGS